MADSTLPYASTKLSAPTADPPNDGSLLRGLRLKKTFRMGDSDVVVLKQVDISIKPGEFIAIEGRSGSGKSTLMHILGALDEADSGLVEFNGQEIQRLTSRDRSKLRNTQFGFVFQFYHLLPELNVLENAMLSSMIEHSWASFKSKGASLRDQATNILSDLGMSHRLKHRPNQLSGGERQRVAIARALMNSPKVLFADEPTGNLDADTGRQIMGVLENLHQNAGQTIVMVTHDRALAREADRVLVLVDGKLEQAK